MKAEKLIELFPNIKQTDEQLDHHFLFTIKGQSYAIPNDQLSPDQKDLLEALTDDTPQHTDVEQSWYQFLRNQTNTPPRELERYRFIMISIQGGNISSEAFRQTLQIVLNKPIWLIWQNHRQVALIEEIKHSEEPLSFDNIMDVLSEDLDAYMRVYISDIQKSLDGAADYFQWLTTISQAVWQASGKRVIHQHDSLLELLPALLSKQDRRYIVESVLKEAKTNESLLDTVKTVIENQGNITSASKQLYMHRNSVQYRVDKFTEVTGNDIRQFDHMIRVYLALLLRE